MCLGRELGLNLVLCMTHNRMVNVHDDPQAPKIMCPPDCGGEHYVYRGHGEFEKRDKE